MERRYTDSCPPSSPHCHNFFEHLTNGQEIKMPALSDSIFFDAITKYYEDIANAKLADEFYEEF